MLSVIESGMAVGKARLYYLPDDNSPWQNNLVLYSWQTILSGLLVDGNISFRLSSMYIEFENKASPDDAVSLPSLDRSRGLAYYSGLSAHPTRDFLRVGVLGSGTSTSGNTTTLQLFASTSGSVGIHGKPFSNAANSTVIGASLVAAPNSADRMTDTLFSSIYFPSDKQKLKLANGDIGLTWQIVLQ
jgi:hypothetical protein